MDEWWQERRRSREENYIGQIRRSRKHRQRRLTRSQKLLSSPIDFFSTTMYALAPQRTFGTTVSLILIDYFTFVEKIEGWSIAWLFIHHKSACPYLTYCKSNLLMSDVNWYVGSFTLLVTKRMMKQKSLYTSHSSIPTSPHKCSLGLLWEITMMTSRVAWVGQTTFNQFMMIVNISPAPASLRRCECLLCGQGLGRSWPSIAIW